MLQQHIIICQVVAQKRLKQKKTSKTFCAKSGLGRLREVSTNLETFGILEDYSLRRGDHLREEIVKGDSTV